MARTLLVVPCYNEANRLDRVAFESFLDEHADVGFLFVDDGSTDATCELLGDMAKQRPERIELLQLAHNSGKGEAVRQGMLRAFERAPRFAGYWDADLAAPLDIVPEFVRVLEEREEITVVFGARVRLLGRSVVRSQLRHFLGRIFATAASQLLQLSVYDTQCGAKLFRCSAAVQGLFAQPFLSGWAFDVELLARMIAQHDAFGGAAVRNLVYELPLPAWEDIGGTKVQPRDVPKALVDLWRIRRRYLAPLRRPLPSTSARKRR